MNRTARTVAVVVGGPVLVSLVALGVALAIREDLPDPVATHWGIDGPDGFVPRDQAVYLALLGLPIGLLVGGLIALLVGRPPGFRRLGGGLGVGTTAFVDLVVVGSLWVQRGLADAHEATGLGVVALLAIAGSVALGLLAAWLTPGSLPAPARSPIPEDAPRLPLAEGEVGVWSQWVVAGWWVAVVAALAVGPVLVLALAGVIPVGFVLVGFAALLIVGSMAVFRVTVGRRGVVVSAGIGIPRFTVPLDEVAEAGTTVVQPMKDFQGYGYRASRDGSYGVVVRAGEALSVRRGDGTTFVITVDGAGEAAALLNTLADRQRAVPA